MLGVEVRGRPREAAGEIEVARERGRGDVRLPLAQQLVDARGIVDHEEARPDLELLREQRREVVLETGGKALGVLEVRRRAVHRENDQLARFGDRRDRLRDLFAAGGETGEQGEDSLRRHGSTV